MASRIDNSNPDPAVERMLQERKKEETTLQKQAEFQQKMVTTKQIAAQAQNAPAQAPAPKPSILSRPQSQKQATAKTSGKNPTSAGSKSAAAAGIPNAKIDSKDSDQKKGSSKKESKDASKADEKRLNQAQQTSVEQRKQKDAEMRDFKAGASDEFFQQAVNLVAQPSPQPEQLAGSSPVHIPREVIDQIVNKVYVGINTKGLKELVIELKEGVLGSGGSINVSSQNGKVNLRFSGLDEQTKSLVRNSKDAISERLKNKDLQLATFAID